MKLPSFRTPSDAGANISQTKLPKVSDVTSDREVGGMVHSESLLSPPREAMDADFQLCLR